MPSKSILSSCLEQLIKTLSTYPPQLYELYASMRLTFDLTGPLTNSYIVEGLGNPESFASCSHGAGRKMGRNEAIRSLCLEDEMRKLDKKGIVL